MRTSAHSSIFWWQRRGDGSGSWQRPEVGAPCWGLPRGSRAAGVWSQLAAAVVEQVPTAVARMPTVCLWTGRDTKLLGFFSSTWRFRHVSLFVCVCLLVIERLDRWNAMPICQMSFSNKHWPLKGLCGRCLICLRPHSLLSVLEKTRVFVKKPSPVGFLGFFWVFGVFWVFLGFFARTRGFLGFFSVSRILLGASRL